MRICVTGAEGFIGRPLVAALRARGNEVVGLDLEARSPGVVTADLRLPGSWQDEVRGSDATVHTAASVSGSSSQRERAWRINTLGTAHVLDADPGRLVHLSSVTVFGFAFPDGVTEDFPPRPEGLPYADSKVAAEQVVLQRHAAGRVRATIVRPGDVYGPGSQPWAVLPARKLKARQFAVPRGGIFSPVHVDDLVPGIVAALDTEAAVGEVVTLSGGAGVPNERFFGAYADALGVTLPVLPSGLLRRLARPAALTSRLVRREDDVNPLSAAYLARTGTYSIAKARRLLGWTPAVDLDEGLRGTVDWLRAEGLL